ncbi:MAG: glycine cleavage system aminomethyltransferase GcvT [Bryobacteraceae bacterium]
MPAAGDLRRTPLYELHRELGARMVEFGGWEMPVQYSGIVDEHLAVRRAVGLFDVSHMGEIEIRGPEALALVEYVTTNQASRLATGQAQYSAMLYDHGGFVDDLLVHKVADDHYFLCINASNQEKDYRHILRYNRFRTEVEFASARYAQLALQGPRALETLARLTTTDLVGIRYYHFTEGEVGGVPARIARTGYTGEDGFELYLAPQHAPRIFRELLRAGEDFGIRPCGLGARNTLRLEAKMALYGHEIDATVRPPEADLDWIVKMNKGEFVGRAALERLAATGIRRKLVGFEMRERVIARDGYPVYVDGRPAGWVTSGGPAPYLNKNIGLCFLPVEFASPGRTIHIGIRGRLAEALTVRTPFYKRPKTNQ